MRDVEFADAEGEAVLQFAFCTLSTAIAAVLRDEQQTALPH